MTNGAAARVDRPGPDPARGRLEVLERVLADEYAVIACEVAAEDPDVLGTRLETSWRPIERVLGKQAVAELATPDPHRRQGKAQV